MESPSKAREVFTLEHMRKGIDEDGRRIKIFTSALTSERAIKANVGAFSYEGGIMETDVEQGRMHSNNLKYTDARHGYGKCVYNSGSFYHGEWKHDRRDGNGKFAYACGDTYEGQWVNGRYHGTGIYTSSTGGDTYEGEWRDDLCSGQGTYTYRDANEKFEGQYLAGLRSGFGTYSFANGNVYTGQYYEGERHGAGTFYFRDSGEAEIGNYHEGNDIGEGARWNADRTRAVRLVDGQSTEPITLEAAEATASRLGLPVPLTRSSSSAMLQVAPTPFTMQAMKLAPTVAAPASTTPAPTEEATSQPLPWWAPPPGAQATPVFGGGFFKLGADGRMAW